MTFWLPWSSKIVFTDGAGSITSVAYSAFPHLKPLMPQQQLCNRTGRDPFSPKCPVIASAQAGLELSSSALPKAGSPISVAQFLGYDEDIPLTHASLQVSSHRSTQLVHCQEQTHRWAEGPYSSFKAFLLQVDISWGGWHLLSAPLTNFYPGTRPLMEPAWLINGPRLLN